MSSDAPKFSTDQGLRPGSRRRIRYRVRWLGLVAVLGAFGLVFFVSRLVSVVAAETLAVILLIVPAIYVLWRKLRANRQRRQAGDEVDVGILPFYGDGSATEPGDDGGSGGEPIDFENPGGDGGVGIGDFGFDGGGGDAGGS